MKFAHWAVAAIWLAAAGGAEAECGPPPASDATLLASPEAVEAIAEAKRSMPNAEGRLWRVETDPPSYLVGTFHVAAGGIEEPGPELAALVAGASGLYLELEGESVEGEVARWGADPKNLFRTDGSRFTDGMSEAERAHAADVLMGYGMPIAVAEQLRPLMLLSLLSVPPCALDQFDGPGLDDNLEEIAEDAGIEVKALETVEEQISALDGPPEEMDPILRMALSQDLDDSALWYLNLALYRTRHIGAMWALGAADMDELVGPEEASKIEAMFWERLVAGRNRVMARRLLPGLREGGKVVAVGALHLPGEDGLVELVRAAGLTVSRVEGDAHSAGEMPAKTGSQLRLMPEPAQ
ncbi:TraB/GumN family protein [Acuticoccus sediminis]|uniref:TraB/GumN family protein n=1 Tax=Acuticoccus sediminis TaxID=2184697 RepID=UPI001CFE433F|nr:TraB/GumN family protein [Acuticoccus sediminis]